MHKPNSLMHYEFLLREYYTSLFNLKLFVDIPFYLSFEFISSTLSFFLTCQLVHFAALCMLAMQIRHFAKTIRKRNCVLLKLKLLYRKLHELILQILTSLVKIINR